MLKGSAIFDVRCEMATISFGRPVAGSKCKRTLSGLSGQLEVKYESQFQFRTFDWPKLAPWRMVSLIVCWATCPAWVSALWHVTFQRVHL